MNWRLSRMLAWRDWRSGELGLLMLALVVAVASVTAISLFVDRLQQAMLNESADFLAADRYVSSSGELPASYRDLAAARQVETVDTLMFPSMVFAGDATSQLVSVKAVSPGYPLRGRVRISSEPFGVGVVTSELPKLGEVWLDSRLFPALGVALGDEIEVGLAKLRIGKVIISEPDRGGSMFDWGPRLLMRLADVPATEVVQPGSRLRYRLLLRGDDADLAALKEELDLQPGQRWVGIKESSPSIGSALSRAERFLLLGGLLAVLLAGLAVVLAAHRYARRHYDHVAVLKTLGTGPNAILGSYVGVLLLVAAVAIAGGLLVGFGLHWLILLALQELMPIALPPPGMRPLVLGAITGLICTMAFALPAFIHLRNVSPMNVIRRDLGATPPSRYLSYTMAAVGVVGLLLWYTQDVLLTLWALGGTTLTLVIFGGLGLLLLRGTRVLGTQAGSLWRFALASLQRRHRENLVQMLVIGLALMLILILVLLRTALLSEWKQQIPEGAPNHFVMNLLPEQVSALQAQLELAELPFDEAFAMVRGRVVEVNGRSAKEHEAAQNPEDRPGSNIGSERNLTWTATLPEGNSLVEGQWWSQESEASEVSLEEEYAREVGVGIGDELRFDIGGRKLTTTVTSLRRLSWESMRPNFFIIFSPGALESFPVTYMTSFHLPVTEKRFLNQLLTRFPTVTVIEVDALIARIQSIISRVTQAVELVLYLVLVAGCLVLVASIQASRDARMHEHALLRALGGSRSLVAGTLAIEFAALGFLAGIIGAIGAEVTVALLQSQAFDLPARAHPWVWVLGPLLGAVLIAGVGMLSTRSLINTPPMLVLRGLK